MSVDGHLHTVFPLGWEIAYLVPIANDATDRMLRDMNDEAELRDLLLLEGGRYIFSAGM